MANIKWCIFKFRAVKGLVKRVVAFVVAYLFVLLAVCSCGEKNKNVAMEYRDPQGKLTSTVTQGLMSLWIGVQKDSSADYLAFVDAMEDGWNMVLDGESGQTFKELYLRDCTLSLRNLLAVEYLHDYVYGIEFSDQQQKSIEDKISQLSSSFGSRKDFEQEMQKYSATVSDYERYLCLMLKQTTLINTFYSENGMRAVTEEKKKEYFENNYSVVYHIFLDTRGRVKDDGTTVSLTQEEKQEKLDFAKQVYEKIQSGQITFEQALLGYTEDAYASSHPDGYFVAKDGKYPDEFTDASFALLPGETALVQSRSGVHIIKRFPMDAQLYDHDSEVYALITQNLITEDFSELVSSVSDGVKIYDDVISGLDASLIKPFALS